MVPSQLQYYWVVTSRPGKETRTDKVKAGPGIAETGPGIVEAGPGTAKAGPRMVKAGLGKMKTKSQASRWEKPRLNKVQ